MPNIKYNFISVLVLMGILSGCSVSRFYKQVEVNSILETTPGYITLPNIEVLTTTELINHCNALDIKSDIGAALLLRCTKELLSRAELAPKTKTSAINQYNDSLLALFKKPTSDKSHLEVNIEGADRYILASEMKAQDPRLQPEIWGEIGLAVTSVRSKSDNVDDAFYPQEGLFNAGTLVAGDIYLDGLVLNVNVQFRAAKPSHKIELGLNNYPLRVSPGAAYLGLLNVADIDDFSFLGFTTPTEAEARRGVFSIGQFVGEKIPLIMIHGLNSDPLIWKYLSMAIFNDPELQATYQILHVYYPSGPPPFFNAMMIRKDIDALLRTLDPDGSRTEGVVIGHSMGGIIAKTLVSTPHFALWDATFRARPESILMSENAELQDIFIFEPVFEHARVFFLDTPHRGSPVADSFIGSLGSALVTLPTTFKSIFKSFIDRVGVGVLTPEMLPFLRDYGPNSVQVLAPGHPLMEALLKLPVQGEAYSIIGNNTQNVCDINVPIECTLISDGVVEFNSAFLGDSGRTLLVQSSHNSFNNQQTIDYILNTLRSNL